MRSALISSVLASLALPRGLLAAPSTPAVVEALSFTPPHSTNSSLSARQNTIDLNNMKYAIEFAKAAYCNNDASQVGTKVTCGNNACPSLGLANIVNYAHLNTDINIRMDGLVMVDHSQRVIVLAFMGSKTVQSYLNEIDFTTAEADDLCRGCKISYGYRKAWTQTQGAIFNAINRARAQFPGYYVICTGHSAGGALATISAAYLRRAGIVADIFSFGSPRLGNNDFANFVSAQSPNQGRNYRVTHYDDPVPSLPASLFGLAHIAPEFWLSRKDASTMDYPLNEIQMCWGIKPSGCRASKGLSLNFDAHSFYFGKVSACYRG
ncbi:hypothetical protein RB597_009628 [Gaeumannomyces tritici]